MAIVLTYLEKHGEHDPRNSASVIDRHGEIIMTYSKVHTCDFGMEAALTPGDDFQVCSLDTENGEVRIGLMICYDRQFPESARILMLKGAEIILTPNACVLEENRIGQFRARAFENMVGVAMANYAAPQLNGRSIAFDPIAFEGEDGSMMRYSIREATPEDHKALNELFAEGDRFHREALPHLFQAPGCLARSEEFLRELLSNESSAVFIAVDEGRAVALISVLVKEAAPIPILKPRRFAAVENLYVKEAARRLGVGHALIQAAGRWALSKGANEMELNVWEFNQGAVAFYEDLGFSTASRKMAVSLSRTDPPPAWSPPVRHFRP